MLDSGKKPSKTPSLISQQTSTILLKYQQFVPLLARLRKTVGLFNVGNELKLKQFGSELRRYWIGRVEEMTSKKPGRSESKILSCHLENNSDIWNPLESVGINHYSLFNQLGLQQ